MIDQHRVLAVIPARGGSKGVPRKNIRDVAGKPLIAWTIEAARSSRFIDRLILSSDDTEIIEVARTYGCEAPFVRPSELATDDATSMAVIRHAIGALPDRYDILVLLQPTSPLRTASDIDQSIMKCVQADAEACVSICLADKSPYWMVRMADDEKLTMFLPQERVADRRQDTPPVYCLNGAVYVGRVDRIGSGETFMTDKTIGYRMPKERSFDIDTELDLKIADTILRESSH